MNAMDGGRARGGTCALENIRMNYMGFALIKIKWKSVRAAARGGMERVRGCVCMYKRW